MSARNKTRYKSYPAKRKHSYYLEAGLSGFLCTCNSKYREKDCLREAYNILNEFADKLFGPEATGNKNEPEERKSDESEEDIDKALQKEVASIKTEISKKPDFRRFQVVESGANGVVFIKTRVPDPVELAHTIVKSSMEVQKSKFLLRLLPVEMTCKAYMEDICSCCEFLFEKYFNGEGTTFAIVYNHRNNDRIKRDELIEKVAALVYKKNEKHKADLKQAKLAILIEIIRSICCISVVPDFFALKKYNLLELAPQKNENSEKGESLEKNENLEKGESLEKNESSEKVESSEKNESLEKGESSEKPESEDQEAEKKTCEEN